MNESQAVLALGALAHEVRLRIIRYLVKCGSEGASAGAIGATVNAAASKVSFHVAALERAGLVNSEKVSRQIIYRINFTAVGSLLSYVMADCCDNNPEILSGCKVKLCC